MDFNDTPQEAEFRAEANRWLSQNAKPRSESGNMMSMFAESEGGVLRGEGVSKLLGFRPKLCRSDGNLRQFAVQRTVAVL